MAATPVIPADLCKLKASPVYEANSRTARATQRSPVLEKKIIIFLHRLYLVLHLLGQTLLPGDVKEPGKHSLL